MIYVYDRCEYWCFEHGWFPDPSHAETARKFLNSLLLRDRQDPEGLNAYAHRCHVANIKWWQDPHTGKPIERNKGELLMLIVSEIAEAMEGERKDLMDSHLPHRKSVEVELADALIRIFDYAGAFRLDLDGAFEEKMKYNAEREDHTHENRVKPGGKKF